MFSAFGVDPDSLVARFTKGLRVIRPGRPPGSRPSIRSARPAGSPLGSCRIGAGLSSQTAALRPPSRSRRSEASRARRQTSEEPRHTPRSGYRPRRTVGPPRRRIRRVGSYCGNLGPPNYRNVILNTESGAGLLPPHVGPPSMPGFTKLRWSSGTVRASRRASVLAGDAA